MNLNFNNQRLLPHQRTTNYWTVWDVPCFCFHCVLENILCQNSWNILERWLIKIMQNTWTDTRKRQMASKQMTFHINTNENCNQTQLCIQNTKSHVCHRCTCLTFFYGDVKCTTLWQDNLTVHYKVKKTFVVWFTINLLLNTQQDPRKVKILFMCHLFINDMASRFLLK